MLLRVPSWVVLPSALQRILKSRGSLQADIGSRREIYIYTAVAERMSAPTQIISPQEEQHLQLLAIFHYIVGGPTAFLACFPLIHLTVGLAMVFGGFSSNQAPPAFVGWLFIILGGGFFLIGQSLAIRIITAGRFLAQRKRYLFVFVVACCECVFMPFGTVLGVFTIILLSQESVKAAFVVPESAPPSH